MVLDAKDAKDKVDVQDMGHVMYQKKRLSDDVCFFEQELLLKMFVK